MPEAYSPIIACVKAGGQWQIIPIDLYYSESTDLVRSLEASFVSQSHH